MGLHRVTCHSTQANTPHLNSSQWRLVLDLPTPEGWKAELTYVAGYIPRWFTHPQTVTHPSHNQPDINTGAVNGLLLYWDVVGDSWCELLVSHHTHTIESLCPVSWHGPAKQGVLDGLWCICRETSDELLGWQWSLQLRDRLMCDSSWSTYCWSRQ